jgi:hypothetical protein
LILLQERAMSNLILEEELRAFERAMPAVREAVAAEQARQSSLTDMRREVLLALAVGVGPTLQVAINQTASGFTFAYGGARFDIEIIGPYHQESGAEESIP